MQVTGKQAVGAGDLVAVVRIAAPPTGTEETLPQVRLASEAASGVIGVVTGRMALVQDEANEHQPEVGPTYRWYSADDPIGEGDYALLTVYGIADVKVAPATAADLQAGQQLTLAESPGTARPLRTESLNGMTVTEGATSIGIVLDTTVTDAQTVPVFITLR